MAPSSISSLSLALPPSPSFHLLFGTTPFPLRGALPIPHLLSSPSPSPSPAPSTLQHRPSPSPPLGLHLLPTLRHRFSLTLDASSAPFNQTGPNGGPSFDYVWPNGGPSFDHVWPNEGSSFGFVWPNEGSLFGLAYRAKQKRGPLFGPVWQNGAERRASARGGVGPMPRSGEKTGPRGVVLGKEGDRGSAGERGRKGGDGGRGVERKEGRVV